MDRHALLDADRSWANEVSRCKDDEGGGHELPHSRHSHLPSLCSFRHCCFLALSLAFSWPYSLRQQCQKCQINPSLSVVPPCARTSDYSPGKSDCSNKLVRLQSMLWWLHASGCVCVPGAVACICAIVALFSVSRAMSKRYWRPKIVSSACSRGAGSPHLCSSPRPWFVALSLSSSCLPPAFLLSVGSF